MILSISQKGLFFADKEMVKRRGNSFPQVNRHWFVFWQSVIFCKVILTKFGLWSCQFKRTLLATKRPVRKLQKFKDFYAFDWKYRRRIFLEFSVPRTAGRVFMLSVSKCRQLVKNPNLTDEEVQQICNTLYGFADLLIRSYIKENPLNYSQGNDGN